MGCRGALKSRGERGTGGIPVGAAKVSELVEAEPILSKCCVTVLDGRVKDHLHSTHDLFPDNALLFRRVELANRETSIDVIT